MKRTRADVQDHVGGCVAFGSHVVLPLNWMRLMQCRALCCVSLSSKREWTLGQIRVSTIICSLCERMIVFDSMKVKALRSISALCFCVAFLGRFGCFAAT
jgi:hypothetical protein